MKKIISIELGFLMIFNILPTKIFAAEEQSLEEIIRPQVEAFAKSIDQKDADGKAQDALITHGIGGNGKKLSVGKSHAITATIMNSELAKEYLTVLCTDLIGFTGELNMDEIYSLGFIKFFFDGTLEYQYRIYDYDAERLHTETPPEDYLKKTPYVRYKNRNEYDESLKIIGGHIAADIDLKVNKIYDDKIVYDVSVVFWDVFDFSAENGSALEKLLGWIGLLLFEPFEWESKFNFQIEIPIEKPEENKVFGDSDGNGKIDVADAYFARLVSAKLVVPTEEQLLLCDVDLDGRITAIDANIIRKYALGIIKELPVS
ncbi:MAG: hypothetical protein E7479_06505 [Ruminococcaceae bacterium]|nr:hypothetical protein [Oscillospiraceae bacterium]